MVNSILNREMLYQPQENEASKGLTKIKYHTYHMPLIFRLQPLSYHPLSWPANQNVKSFTSCYMLDRLRAKRNDGKKKLTLSPGRKNSWITLGWHNNRRRKLLHSVRYASLSKLHRTSIIITGYIALLIFQENLLNYNTNWK